ncbi:MAG: hypothetical protein K2Y30_13820 [Flavobacteriaceae bacterium]|uniref:Cytochrome c domain-containing protein n=1 Tax=Flavobacterium kayseriense TaxID=2764714 RepID=A0ABR7J8F2_9FLAO|nr:hypothetical protein [Flavobacterium kayseriense]MBC5841782.1 hypothetical protein [Flavobacterium kayseriense]MBC5848311.1 hypothetical protein [Flavobacterium kayseriense]MBU0942395.1 hypothetical protein [Bacteroidota bacterium]MBX9889002.1 hypothetical protein [Flavobacteriaceae bacterium]
MKIKIIITSMIALFAFSSFKVTDISQKYMSVMKINESDLKKPKSHFSQAMVSCAKCHDCQNDNPIIQDSIRIIEQDDSINFKEKSFKVLKSKTKKVNKENTISTDVESTNNLKRR